LLSHDYTNAANNIIVQKRDNKSCDNFVTAEILYTLWKIIVIHIYIFLIKNFNINTKKEQLNYTKSRIYIENLATHHYYINGKATSVLPQKDTPPCKNLRIASCPSTLSQDCIHRLTK
jgi:hypothetical protein